MTENEIDIDTLSGVELGIACAVEIMGWPLIGLGWSLVAFADGDVSYPHVYAPKGSLCVCRAPGAYGEPWQPWSDLRAAGEVLDKMRADRWQCSMDVYATRSWCTFDKEEGQEFRSIADNLPTAICRAALKAVRGEREG